MVDDDNDDGSDYSRCIAVYGYFLRSKIMFHHKHPLVIGNLALDDYKTKIQHQPEVPLHARYSTCLSTILTHLFSLSHRALSL
jgi:hypothetical protein